MGGDANAASSERLRKVRVALPPILSFALAAILLVVGAIALWQAWLIWSVQRGSAQADVARAQVAAQIAAQVRSDQDAIAQALANPEIQQALQQADGREAAAAALRRLLPAATDAELYSSNLDEVLSGDLRALGYAKAAALMQAKINPAQPLAEMRREHDGSEQLMIAMPAQVDGKVVAFAVVEQPFAPILDTFRRTRVHDVRLDLRQGDGRGDALIATIGDVSAYTSTDVGEVIAGTRLRIGKADAERFLLLPRAPFLLLFIGLVATAAGLAALWVRKVGMRQALESLQRRPREEGSQLTMTEVLREEAAAAAGAAKTAVAAPATAAAKAPSGPVQIDRSIFRAYDIRGVVGKSLSVDIARLIGRAIGSEARERGLEEIVVGRDGRLSGPDLSKGLIDGLKTCGLRVFDIGAAPTPLTYFGAFHLRTGSCVSLTGSHNPPDYNGFKIVLGGETLAEDAIQGLYKRIVEQAFVGGDGSVQTIDISGDYTQRIADDVQLGRRMKVVVDCGNGIAGAIAPQVLEAIGAEVTPLYCEVDGTFPNHHPDPSDPHNLQDLILSVKQVGADIGLAFDGDGDRLGVVTAAGEIIYPDRLLMLFAMDILQRNPGATIIYDVKCTGHLQPLILQHGGSPLMWRTGHSLIKAKMRETDAAMAGEMSGHFFFGERWYGFDDGIYSAARLLEILAGDLEERAPAEIFATLPKGVSTPELKIEMREGEHYKFMEAFKDNAIFDGARLTTIDGVRADWPDGWGLVRASNTTPVLVLRFDADDAAALARIQAIFRKQILATDDTLKLPF
ncbi:MAG: phosphomannomutase/phosphoglucomutase [Dokdonella sp.]|nr:phosphomannomutase/phosphoglucomutase [Dokdonella sp.]MBX3687772.1 phosphomannomutase/phosphoglucomutase [Dokdonella sp.]